MSCWSAEKTGSVKIASTGVSRGVFAESNAVTSRAVRIASGAGRARFARPNRHITSIGQRQRVELQDYAVVWTEVPAGHRLNPCPNRLRVEPLDMATDDGPGRQHDSVVRTERVDERAGDRLPDAGDVHARIHRYTQRSPGLDDEIYRSGRRILLGGRCRTEQTDHGQGTGERMERSRQHDDLRQAGKDILPPCHAHVAESVVMS